MGNIRENEEMNILSLKFWNSLSLEQKDEYTKLLNYYNNRSYNKAIYRLNKGSVRNVVFGAIDCFCDAHPSAIDKVHKNSLAKRITGLFNNYLFNNEKLSKCINNETKK